MRDAYGIRPLRAGDPAVGARLQRAAKAGQLTRGTDARALGDLYATLLQGFSVQARDGVPKARLMKMVTAAISLLDTSDVVSTATDNSGAGRETRVFEGHTPRVQEQ